MFCWHLWLSRLPTNSWDTPGDGRHAGHPETAKDGYTRPTTAAGTIQRGQEECQAATTGRQTHTFITTLMHWLIHTWFNLPVTCYISKHTLTYTGIHLHNCICKTTWFLCVIVQAGLLQWTRLFPSLRHRGQNRPPMQPRPQAETQPSTQPPLLDNSPVAEEQVCFCVCLNCLS